MNLIFAQIKFRHTLYHHSSETCDSSANGAAMAIGSKSDKKSNGAAPRDIGSWCEMSRVRGIREGQRPT